jgi:hypothetical protein
MPAILALILIAIVVIAALAVASFAVHLLFSPWLLVAAVVALVWFRFRPRRSHR